MAFARASAEATKAKLEFTEMEVSLKKQAQLTEQEQLSKDKALRQKAEFEADLQLLGDRMEAATAAAQARALEAYGGDDLVSQGFEFETANNGLPVSHIDPGECTEEHVEQQAKHIAQYARLGPQVVKTEPGHLELAREDPLTSQKPTPPSPIHGPDHSAYPLLNASASEFQPVTINTMAAGTPVNPQQPSNSLANDLTKFLLKKAVNDTSFLFHRPP